MGMPSSAWMADHRLNLCLRHVTTRVNGHMTSHTQPLGKAAVTGLPPTVASRAASGDPVTPVDRPDSQPIATTPMTILSGDASAILLPRSCRQRIQRERVLSL